MERYDTYYLPVKYVCCATHTDIDAGIVSFDSYKTDFLIRFMA